MVKQVTKWQAADGSSHNTKLEALQHEAETELRKFVAPSAAESIVRNCHKVSAVIERLAREIPRCADEEESR